MSHSWSVCPECNRMIPSEHMHMEIVPCEHPNGKLVYMCNWCLRGIPSPEIYFKNEIQITCIWCDSTNVRKVSEQQYECDDCGDTFIL